MFFAEIMFQVAYACTDSRTMELRAIKSKHKAHLKTTFLAEFLEIHY